MPQETLFDLWRSVHQLNKKYFPENKLVPIVGNGKTYRPRVMCLFINPTARNASADPAWKGPDFLLSEQKTSGEYFINLDCSTTT